VFRKIIPPGFRLTRYYKIGDSEFQAGLFLTAKGNLVFLAVSVFIFKGQKKQT
jgi:hypothetical protein